MTDEELDKLCDTLINLPAHVVEAVIELKRLAIQCRALERDLEWTRERVKNLAGTDPRFTVTEVEGKCYVRVRYTDFVVAEFDLPLKAPG